MTQNRLEIDNASIPLVKFDALVKWTPKVGDIIIWHGWFRRWYGVINGLDRQKIYVITEGLPCLLFTLTQDQYPKNTITVTRDKILRASTGEYHILQGDIWYI